MNDDTQHTHHNYQEELEQLWAAAVESYKDKGDHTAQTLFGEADKRFIDFIGASTQEIYDFIEDYVKYDGTPDFATFAMVQDIRKNYYYVVQKGKRSTNVLDVSSIPSKQDEVDGIAWLPRIIPKAIAKLKGELGPDIMFGCGGDRRFFNENNLHMAEFLQLVWNNMDNQKAIISYVKARRG